MYDYKKKIKIDGSHISSSMSIETEAPYLLLYKKKEDEEWYWYLLVFRSILPFIGFFFY